mmetsp:Transcript_31664/g.34624  ORF Transcript_31664/g.34624 Transcript_31664/m.34624 type:complete len:98 (-) Transcript_31664:2266-2559(-)
MKTNNKNKTKQAKNKKQTTNNYNTKQQRRKQEKQTTTRERERMRQDILEVYMIITLLHSRFFQSFQCQGYLQSFSEIFLCTALAQLPIILEDQHHES